MTRLLGWPAVLLVFPTLILLHLYVAPYTKVEESFNTQAVHDILTYGIPRINASEQLNAHYDHMTFSGAVPRTFTGAIVLAALSTPFLWLNDAFDRQLLARAVLGCLNALSLCCYAETARRAFGKTAAVWFLLLQTSQFHIFFYASRPLPNMFAFTLTTMALSLLLPKATPVQTSLNRIRLAVFLLTIAAVILRSEIAILIFCHVAYLIVKQAATFGHFYYGIALLRSTAIPAGILGVLIGLCITVPIDTFLWQSHIYLWPELSAFLFNVFPPDNGTGASAWGTQPWHWYFTGALPRLLLIPPIYLLLWLKAVFTPAISTPALDLILPNLAYTVVYSFLPHKETRFIFPVVPPLTLAGALSASYIWTRRWRTQLYNLLSLSLGLSIALSAFLSHSVLLPLSALSYPGAHALNALHKHASSHISTAPDLPRKKTKNTITIHLDNLSTQTGITRFLQHPNPPTEPGSTRWVYDKSDNATDLLNPLWWTQFNYTIMESPHLAIGSWDVVSVIYGPGPARILHPHEKNGKREQPASLTTTTTTTTTTSAANRPPNDSQITGLDHLALHMYGQPGIYLSTATRQILRDGHGTQSLSLALGGRQPWSWTHGWWVDVAWTPKLYVLKRSTAALPLQDGVDDDASD